MMEETLVRMAAPTLAGIKTGSLFPYYYRNREALGEEMGRLNRLLIPRGLLLVLLRLTDRSALLYLFRPADLEKDLTDRRACITFWSVFRKKRGFRTRSVFFSVIRLRT